METFKISLSISKQDGFSFETAIVIDKTSSIEGIQAEYDWLEKNYPGYELDGRSMKIEGDKMYDVMNITYEGKSKTIYFNIDKFFGKF